MRFWLRWCVFHTSRGFVKGCFAFPVEVRFAFEAELYWLSFLQLKKRLNIIGTSSRLNVILLMLHILFTTSQSLFHGRFGTVG